MHVADIELPPSLERLRDLAYDYWWSWSPRAARLFSRIDPEPWHRYHNPVQLLINVEPQQWMRLLSDPEFVRLYGEVIQALDEYRGRPRWYAQQDGAIPGPIAYFSMEFGIHESLGIYSGGLGVLAGDHCKAASDLGVPLVGVGLLYRSGYFRQTVDADGFQQHTYPDYDFARLPVLPVQAPAGGVLTVPVDLPGRVVQVAVWKAQVGLVPVLMLDTDIPLNDPADRPITGIALRARPRDAAVPGDRARHRRRARAARAVRPPRGLAHERGPRGVPGARARARAGARRGDSLEEALAAVKRTTVFTTHTPVPAGNEAFDRKLVRRYLDPWIRDVGCEPDEALALGARQRQLQHDRVLDPARRLDQRREPAARRGLLGDVAAPVPGGARGARRLRHERRPHRELGRPRDARTSTSSTWTRSGSSGCSSPRSGAVVKTAPDAALWAAHRAQKERLVRFVRERVRVQSARHGLSPDELRQVEGLLDPHALTIGFARRFATYKRAFLICPTSSGCARSSATPSARCSSCSRARRTPPTARARRWCGVCSR